MPGSEEGRRARILIVDDHQDNVDVLQARLESWGFQTDTAMSGEEALACVRRHAPDLMLLDVMMPGMDGHEVARRIKSNESLPFIPIIMQTALDSIENKVEGLDAGADDYITKPIEFAELEARIRSMLRIKKLQEDLTDRETKLRDANAKLTLMSETDGLTGLYNRRMLEQLLEEMYAHSERLVEPLSCVMCDLDKFKSVNDTYGHQAGDAVLRQFAAILKQEAREIDRVGRYGGEEFMVLLPGTVLDAAVTFAERVRKVVEDHRFDIHTGAIARTVSIGVAGWPHPKVTSTDRLVCAADDALYVAKEMGRNRVVRFDSEEFRAHVGGTTGHTDPLVADAAVPASPAAAHADREIARHSLRDREARSEDHRATA